MQCELTPGSVDGHVGLCFWLVGPSVLDGLPSTLVQTFVVSRENSDDHLNVPPPSSGLCDWSQLLTNVLIAVTFASFLAVLFCALSMIATLCQSTASIARLQILWSCLILLYRKSFGPYFIYNLPYSISIY